MAPNNCAIDIGQGEVSVRLNSAAFRKTPGCGVNVITTYVRVVSAQVCGVQVDDTVYVIRYMEAIGHMYRIGGQRW